MDDHVRKHINIYKFIFLPWGLFTTSPIWYGMVRALEWLLDGINHISFPSWTRISLFVFGELVIISFLFIYPRVLPRGKKNCHTVYVLVCPENLDYDKYITGDFVSNYKKHASESITNLQVITPSFIKRRTFNKRVDRFKNRGKNYWDCKSWGKLHKKLKGSIYVSGYLVSRKSNQKDNFVFKLSITVAYNDLNKFLTPVMIQELKMNFQSQSLIDKDFELEQFDLFSNHFATFSEYLIGWSHLVSGNLIPAYNMHKDIFLNDKQSFFKRGHLKNLENVIYLEAITIIKNCKHFPKSVVIDCSDFLIKIFPYLADVHINVARSIIMTSSEEEFNLSISKAFMVIDKAKINKDNRLVLIANRAYLLLLSQKYTQAEKEYETFFKKGFKSVAEEVIRYCDEQIKQCTEQEKPTAFYVKLLMEIKLKKPYHEISETYKKALKNIPEGHYYRKKLLSLLER